MIASSKPEFRESLECHRLCSYPLHIYASKEYLKKKGTPQCVQDLNHHNIVAWKEPLPDYMFLHVDNYLLYMGRKLHNPRRPFLSVENDMSLVRSVKKGLGIGFLAEFLADNDPELERITLKDQDPFPEEGMHAKYIIYPKSVKKLARHAQLIDFIKEHAKALDHASLKQ